MTLLQRGSRGDDVRRLQRVLTLLGDLDGPIDGIFGPQTQAAVRSFQRRHDLVADGIAGPNTNARIDEVLHDAEEPLRLLRHAWRELASAELDVDPPAAAPPPQPGDGNGSGEVAPHDPDRANALLEVAFAEFSRPVTEPDGPGWERIDDYIRGPDGLGWDWEERYVANRQFAWCGAFAAYCYGQVGLSADVRKQVMASCYRLHSWARGTPRLLPVEAMAPGDIVLVGPEGGRRWGAHITLCEDPDDAGRVATYEGNAQGRSPDGEPYEGVIRRFRPYASDELPRKRYRVRHVIRPLPEDFQ